MRIAPAGRGPGPRRSGLVVLAVAAVAFLATSPALPTLQATAVGEVVLGPGAAVDHPVRVHLGPGAADGATRSSLRMGFRAANGLDMGSSSAVTARLGRVGEPAPASELGGVSLPLEDCGAGCDLDYVAHFQADPTVLAGSIARYQVDLRIEYACCGQPTAALATIELASPASGPPPATWSLITGLLGLIAGWVAGPRLDSALGRRRRWPAIALGTLPVVLLIGFAVPRLALIGSYGAGIGNLLLAIVDPWSLILLTTLAWGVWRGIGRWEIDGGWALGLGAVAMTGLGGLWLAWWTTLDPVVQPLLAAAAAAMLGLLAGTVIGQAWRIDRRAAHDRAVAGAAVVSHGVVIAGFGFLAVDSLYQPSSGVTGLAAIIPAGLIALAFRRWFLGRRAWLILFDVVVAGAGLIGTAAFVLPDGGLLSLGQEPIGDVAVGIATCAAVISLITAFHRMPDRRSGESDGSAPDAVTGPIRDRSDVVDGAPLISARGPSPLPPTS